MINVGAENRCLRAEIRNIVACFRAAGHGPKVGKRVSIEPGRVTGTGGVALAAWVACHDGCAFAPGAKHAVQAKRLGIETTAGLLGDFQKKIGIIDPCAGWNDRSYIELKKRAIGGVVLGRPGNEGFPPARAVERTDPIKRRIGRRMKENLISPSCGTEEKSHA